MPFVSWQVCLLAQTHCPGNAPDLLNHHQNGGFLSNGAIDKQEEDYIAYLIIEFFYWQCPSKLPEIILFASASILVINTVENFSNNARSDTRV